MQPVKAVKCFVQPETKRYRVEWAIDIEAKTPREAAEIARKIQLDPDSLATVFDVTEHDTAGDAARVDLLESEEENGQ